MTQNEASDLIPNITSVLPYAESVTIVDGGSMDLTIPYFRNWAKKEPKIRYFIHPWPNSFPEQRNRYLKHVAEIAQEGDWLLVVDPDEYLEEKSLQSLQLLIQAAEKLNKTMVGFRCRSVSLEGPHRVWENLDEYWKHFLMKWYPSFQYTGFLCHEGKAGIPHRIMDTEFIYEHRKQNDIIWIRGFRNAITAGSGSNLGNQTPLWEKFKTTIKQYSGCETWHQIYAYMLKGNIDQNIKQLFIDHMFEGTPQASDRCWKNYDWDGSSEWREAYKSYFRMLHPEEEPEEFKGVHIP